MLNLAVADTDCVSIKYLMEVRRLNLEQIMEIIEKLSEMNYIEIVHIKKFKLYEEVQLLLSSINENITKIINYKADADYETLKQKLSNDLDKYRKLENILKEECKSNK